MMIIVHISPKYVPWLIALSAVALAAGLGVLAS
jgi:hypothetical protein